jgi:2,3-bisphosphoglycerate-dependent phosphoglycerate mutase
VTTLLLARHGETDWNRELRVQGTSDTELNALGRSQAAELAQQLADTPLDAIYSSDLSRARETAEIVAVTTGHEVRVDPGLRERDFGSWEGLTREEIDARFADHEQHDGETYEQVRARVLATAHRIVAAHPGETVLVVSHGGALNALWHDAVGERLGRWANCAVYGLRFQDGAFRELD